MNIIVTGASRGIGYELVKQLSADSSNKVVAISRNKQALLKLQNDCISFNKNASVAVIQFDLSDVNSIATVIKYILKEINEVDILVNNAGTLVNKPFPKISIDELEKIYRVNVFSVFKLTQELLPFFNKKQKAHIVNISSMGGVQGSVKFSGLSAYSSSKAALATLTECLAEELKEKNIVVNCLALGAVQTEMLSEAFPQYKAPISAAEIAKFIADFAVTGSHYFNGKIIPVALSTP